MKTDYVKIAREAIEEYIKSKKVKDFPEYKNVTQKSGAFVSIYKKNNKRPEMSDKELELRGCIGTFLPTQKNVVLEIIRNAISAATTDYRFNPITLEELPSLCYSVDILKVPKLVKNIKELNPKKYGIIVRCGTRTGLLLPDLDGVDKTEQQIWITCQKAGINPKKEKIELYKFLVDRYKE